MRIKNIVFRSFIFLLIADVIFYLGNSLNVAIDTTSFTFIFKSVSLGSTVIFIRTLNIKNIKNYLPKAPFQLLVTFVFWNIITIILGFIYANDYWDLKFLTLTSIFGMMVPLSIVYGIMFAQSIKMFSFVVRRLFPYTLLLLPILLLFRDLYARTVIGISLFILFSPYFEKRTKWILWSIGFTSIFLFFDIRANALRIGVSFFLILLFYFRNIVNLSLLKIASIFSYLAPLYFLYAGITGQYNIFNPDNKNTGYSVGNNEDEYKELTADTRTMLYKEVLLSMSRKNSFIFGEGAAATYQSEIFSYFGDDRGRYGAEVGFLNTLLYSGIIGVLLYGLILFSASYFAMYHSNNYLCKMLSLFVSFRWILFFIEDITRYDLNYYFLWIAIGLCLSNDFRSLSDNSIKKYFNVVYYFGLKKRISS